MSVRASAHRSRLARIWRERPGRASRAAGEVVAAGGAEVAVVAGERGGTMTFDELAMEFDDERRHDIVASVKVVPKGRAKKEEGPRSERH